MSLVGLDHLHCRPSILSAKLGLGENQTADEPTAGCVQRNKKKREFLLLPPRHPRSLCAFAGTPANCQSVAVSSNWSELGGVKGSLLRSAMPGCEIVNLCESRITICLRRLALNIGTQVAGATSPAKEKGRVTQLKRGPNHLPQVVPTTQD